MLYAVYDLKVSPPTYDFVGFLVAAERQRRIAGEDGIRVIIVRGPNFGFRDDDLPPHDWRVRQKMLEKIVIPMCDLLPSVKSCIVLNADEVAKADFPVGWTQFNRISHYGTALCVDVARSGLFPLNVDAEKDDRLVTISMRQSAYWPTRNSDNAAWHFLALKLQENGYKAVFIPDEKTVRLPGFSYDNEAATDLMKRAKLYVSARLNLFVNNGPAWMALFLNQARCLVFKMCSADAPCVSEAFFTKVGLLPAGQYGRKYHRIVWGNDDSKTLIEETFKELEGKIDYDALPKIDPKSGLRIASFDATLNNSKETMLAQARENMKRDLPWFDGSPSSTKTALIVGGGPSLADTLKILRYRKERGGDIYALNGAHDWLIERGLIPDYHVLLDSRAENVAFVQKPHKRVKYLVSAYCHPSVFDALAGYDVTLWFSDMEGMQMLVQGIQDRPVCLVGGGATVGLKTQYLCYLRGYRKLHHFGFDSSYRNDENHAYPQPMNAKESRVEIIANGKKFICAPWMAQQAQTWQSQVRKLINLDCEIVVHGDGLIPWITQFLSGQQQAA